MAILKHREIRGAVLQLSPVTPPKFRKSAKNIGDLIYLLEDLAIKRTKSDGMPFNLLMPTAAFKNELKAFADVVGYSWAETTIRKASEVAGHNFSMKFLYWIYIQEMNK